MAISQFEPKTNNGIFQIPTAGLFSWDSWPNRMTHRL